MPCEKKSGEKRESHCLDSQIHQTFRRPLKEKYSRYAMLTIKKQRCRNTKKINDCSKSESNDKSGKKHNLNKGTHDEP
ncbi:hypothetical protein DICVIV_11051 [Dictyocaulus viviparus]|uniref:Uncharacterized protein n=1 Tax=Dictyocaulus viviparus TaxID=29172 RepID=A0A0D8XGS6_DICVI|nr:hypothetical protein DICVIV_11051 [Dictyocaulus viviparus]